MLAAGGARVLHVIPTKAKMAKPGSATSNWSMFSAVFCAVLSLSLANVNLRGDRYVQKFDIPVFADKHSVTIAEDTDGVYEEDWETLLPMLDRHRRDADGSCFDKERKNLGTVTEAHNSYRFGNDTNQGLALTWCGEGDSGNLIVVTTQEVSSLFKTYVKQSVVYRTVDQGKTFENINHFVDNAIIRKTNGLQRNPHDSFSVYLVAHSTSSHYKMYVTTDGGTNFNPYTIPYDLEDSFHFHPEKKYKSHILGQSSDKILYITKDNGGSWNRIADNVHDFKWGTTDSESDPFYKGLTLYALVHSSTGEWWSAGTRHFVLKKSNDGGKTWSILLAKAQSFGIESKFLYASITDESSSKRIMKVSTNAGQTWDETLLPSIIDEQFYSILDSSEGMIFMHVDNPGDTGHGTLYTSGDKGIIFSESLEKHLYPNFGQQTDFYKVESMRGVYIASQMSEDDSIHTRISYDRGGVWGSIPRPANVPCKDESKECSLQLHNTYSISQGIKANPLLTVESATGLILAHGHIADSLQTTNPDVYITTDGGYTWRKILDGPHFYQVADSGGLILAVPMENKTATYLKFSLDMGNCWHTYNFTEEPLHFTGLLTEPGSRSLKVSLWGFGEKDRIWNVHTIDFGKVITRKCGSEDYEQFTAHSQHRKNEKKDVQGCLLGVRETFLTLKTDSWCQNGYYFRPQKNSENCVCTREDYECDFAYYRPEGSDECVEEKEFTKKHVEICERGQIKELISGGYRKIPGDKCTGGYVPLPTKEVNLKEKCKEGDEIKIIKQQVKQSYIEKVERVDEVDSPKPTPSQSSHKRFLIIGAISIVLGGLVSVMSLYFVCRYYALRRHQVTYRYSLLNQSEEQDFDGDLEHVLTSQKTVYDDSEDEDIETSRPALPNGHASSGHPRPRPTKPTSNVMSYHDDSDVDMLE